MRRGHRKYFWSKTAVSQAGARKRPAARCEVETATTASEALRSALAKVPDLMILDLTLAAASFDSFRDGFAVLHWLRHMLPDAYFPVIIHIADASPLVDQRARAAGVFAVIRKGNKATNILDVVRQAFEQPSPPATDDSYAAAA